jgi:cystathionine gamma-synthase
LGDVDTWAEVAQGRLPGHIYSRNTNPTVAAFEEKVRVLEGAEAATSFSTGMAAISNTLFALLSPGDIVVSVKDTYGGTNKIFLEFLPRFGIQVRLCETADHEAIEAQVLDIARLARTAAAVGAVVVVDNTMATPINQRPLALGADIVLHSATKFLGGHADALGGVICGRSDLVGRVFHFREINGAILDPMAAYLLLRGMNTLDLRVRRQNENAMRIARFLRTHDAVDAVLYPGLESHPGHEIARRQMSAFGGVLSFAPKGGFEAVRAVLPRLHFAHLVVRPTYN